MKPAIKQIQEIRAKNNNNWMKILDIALTCAPGMTIKIMEDIISSDNDITKLMTKIISNHKKD